MTESELREHLPSEDVFLAASSNLVILNSLQKQIKVIEKSIMSKVKSNTSFKQLLSVPGIGEILGLTIVLETGDINRFKNVGNYASYCRCVNSERLSNEKKKGTNNRKNANKYLSWAFVEAAHFAIRHNEVIKKYYQKKTSKKNSIVAIKTIAHKLARACFYIIRDGVKFDINLAFMK
jgi:transposase